MIDEGDESSFHFYDCFFFALGVLLVITCASLFINLFFLEGQGGVSGVSGRWSARVEEKWQWEEYAFSF